MTNQQIEIVLLTYPDLVASAKAVWQRAELDREEVEAKLQRKFREENTEYTVADIKALIHASPERRQAKLKEISAEEKFNAVYETLMSMKRLAGLREAF